VARLETLAELGKVCSSNKIHVEIREQINIDFSGGGAQAMKNIAEVVWV
jgi:hypothetical protein